MFCFIIHIIVNLLLCQICKLDIFSMYTYCSICRVQQYPWLQAFTVGCGICSAWIRGYCTCSLDHSLCWWSPDLLKWVIVENPHAGLGTPSLLFPAPASLRLSFSFITCSWSVECRCSLENQFKIQSLHSSWWGRPVIAAASGLGGVSPMLGPGLPLPGHCLFCEALAMACTLLFPLSPLIQVLRIKKCPTAGHGDAHLWLPALWEGKAGGSWVQAQLRQCTDLGRPCHKIKRLGNTAQCKGPGFNPQYHEKFKKSESRRTL